MSHVSPNTTGLDLSRRAARAIKRIQELLETDEDLCALDYTILSKSLALASQENFATEVSLDGEGLSTPLTLYLRTLGHFSVCSLR